MTWCSPWICPNGHVPKQIFDTSPPKCGTCGARMVDENVQRAERERDATKKDHAKRKKDWRHDDDQA